MEAQGATTHDSSMHSSLYEQEEEFHGMKPWTWMVEMKYLQEQLS